MKRDVYRSQINTQKLIVRKYEINFLDYNGKKSTLNAKGLLATCIQHEMDHLEGILFIDHLSNMKRNMIVKKLIKTRKQSKKNRSSLR